MFCPKCKKALKLDDVDFNSKGNKDNYYVCNDCFISCISYIRNFKIVKIDYFDEEGYIFKSEGSFTNGTY